MASKTTTEIAALAQGVTPQQRHVIEVILGEFTKAGYPAHISLAAVANAYGESLLDPTAVGDGGRSIGLFQANMKAGAGRGHSKIDLMDPVYNTRVILGEVRKSRRLISPINSPNIANAIAFFVSEVEKPADFGQATAQRLRYFQKLFPTISVNSKIADLPTLTVASTAVRVGLIALLLGSSALLYRRLR